MANTIYKDITIKVDNAAGSLTDITSYLSSGAIRAVQDLIEDTSMADDERQYLTGLAGSTFPIAGMVNSTTDGIFGPLIGNRTTALKTIQYDSGTPSGVYRGEAFFGSVEYSGSTNSLQTFSGEGTIDGAITRTSVAL